LAQDGTAELAVSSLPKMGAKVAPNGEPVRTRPEDGLENNRLFPCCHATIAGLAPATEAQAATHRLITNAQNRSSFTIKPPFWKFEKSESNAMGNPEMSSDPSPPAPISDQSYLSKY